MGVRDIVVIGGSAGSIAAISDLVGGLPSDFPGSVFVVVHFPGSVSSTLPRILSRAAPLPARHARDGEPIEPGRIYVAPPDWHLHLNEGHIRLTRGPKENGHRPAIDPLFRTAAHQFGPRVLGVVLSGNLNDGTAGLLTIRQYGGLALVQSLETALYPGMPRSAIDHGAADHVLSVPEMSELIGRLAVRATSRGHAHSAAAFTEQAMDAEHHASVIRNVLHTGIRVSDAAEPAFSSAG